MTADNARAHGQWRKPGLCQSGECVEVAAAPGAVLIRDSKSPGQVMTVRRDMFEDLVRAVQRGEYDDLTGG